MPIDIYLRVPEDPTYDPNQIEVDDSLFRFLQIIEMILTTRKGDILGDSNFGVGLEAYLWNQYVSVSTIKSEIMAQIVEYANPFVPNIPFDVDVNFVAGDQFDYILVDVIIDGEKVIGIAASP
jgi:hypothetical protein